MFSAAQYFNWAAVAVAATCLAVRLQASDSPSARATRLFLLAQPLYFIVLFPISMLLSKRIFYAGYISTAIIDCALQLWVVVAIAQELRGNSAKTASLRAWILLVAVGTTAIAAFTLIDSPKAFCGFESTWTQVSQILSTARHVAILAVVAYAYWVVTPWPKTAFLSWAALSVDALGDLIASRTDLVSLFSYHHLTQYIPTVGFVIAGCLWWRIPVAPDCPLHLPSPQDHPLKRGGVVL